jgi:hypothetical protein
LRSNPFSIIALPPSTALQQMSRNLQTEQQAIYPPASSSTGPPLVEDRVAEHRVPEHRVPEHRAPEYRPPEHPAGSSAANRLGVLPGRIWLYAAAGLIAVGLAAGGGYRWARGKQAPPAPAVPAEKADSARAHLGFSATREGPVWKLSWDRAAMDALNPVGAVLSIEDGGYLQQLPLAPADLASGILFYTPQSNDLTFGLRIDRGGAHVEEQVRVLAPTRVPFDRAQQSFPAKAPVQAQAAPGVTPPNAQPPAEAASTTPPTPPPSAPPRKFVLPATTGQSASASISENPVPQPPVVVLAVPVPPNLPRANPDFGPSPAPAPSKSEPAAAAAVLPSPSPVASSKQAPTPAPPEAAPPSPANYVGPRPTRQVSPPAPKVVPPGVSQVEVMVEIDVHGKVTKASPVGWTPVNAPLMISATRAASSWDFAPAQLNGHAVPSQMNLIFKF